MTLLPDFFIFGYYYDYAAISIARLFNKYLEFIFIIRSFEIIGIFLYKFEYFFKTLTLDS